MDFLLFPFERLYHNESMKGDVCFISLNLIKLIGCNKTHFIHWPCRHLFKTLYDHLPVEIFRSDFVKLGSKILHLFFAEKWSLAPTAIIMFTVAILQQAMVKPSNIIAHKKDFKLHAQPQTGAYSCYTFLLVIQYESYIGLASSDQFLGHALF